MRNPGVDFAIALADAPEKGIIPRRMLWVNAKSRVDGSFQGFGYWSGDEDLQFTLQDGQTGDTVTRSYIGLGTELVIPPIPRISSLTIQTIECQLSQTHLAVQQMIREYTVRFCKVDIHEALLSTTSRKLVGNPELSLVGEVDENTIDTPAAGGEGAATLSIVSDAIRSLTISNPAKSSHQQQLNRNSNDFFNEYANAFQNVQVSWGEDD